MEPKPMRHGVKPFNAMKKTCYAMMLVALGATASSSCQKEQETALPAMEETIPVKVTFFIEDETKAVLSDQLGIVWEAGDAIRFQGNTGAVEGTLTADGISDNGYKATFSLEIPNVMNESPKGVFRYNWSTRNLAEWDFGGLQHSVTDPSATFADGNRLSYTQVQAGQMNKAFLFMHSGTSWDVEIPQAETTPVEINVKMHIVGSVFRVLPYTEDYTDETVESVTLSLLSNQNLGGTVVYDYVNGTYRDANEVNWLTDKNISVSLGEGFSLSEVTSRSASKGIYFPMSRTNTDLEGMKVIVKTDKATYTYENTAAFAVQDNVVKNIFIKLDAAHRVGNDTVRGTYNFWGGIGEGQTWSFDAGVQNAVGLSYWVVSVKDEGSEDRRTIEARDNPEFYVADFTCIDDATGAPADWLTVGYRPNDTWWIATLQANTDRADRSATVTATFPDNNNGYLLEDGFKTRTVHIKQQGQVTLTPVISNLSATTVAAAGGSVTATLGLQVDGVDATDDQFNQYISQVMLTAVSGSVSREGRTLTIQVGVNPKTEARTVTVTAATKDASASVELTQEASETAMTQTYTYGFSAWQEAGKTDTEPGNTLFSMSYDNAEEVTVSRNWVIVMAGVRDDNTGEVPTDVESFLKYGFQLTQAEYDAMAAFVKFEVAFSAGETFIYFNGVTANTTGVVRTFDRWWKTSDLSADFVHVSITQAAE